jgi:hypothetical protein
MHTSRLLQLPAAIGLLLAAVAPLAAQTVHISVDVTQDRIPVSPYIYGKNDGVGHPTSPLSEAGFQLLRDAGVRMLRMHGGNNGTKYNWQKKLTSHPDWYATTSAPPMTGTTPRPGLQQHLPGVQSMWCFQLIGKVADNTAHNFNDWGYNDQWWSGGTESRVAGFPIRPAEAMHSRKAIRRSI